MIWDVSGFAFRLKKAAPISDRELLPATYVFAYVVVPIILLCLYYILFRKIIIGLPGLRSV